MFLSSFSSPGASVRVYSGAQSVHLLTFFSSGSAGSQRDIFLLVIILKFYLFSCCWVLQAFSLFFRDVSWLLLAGMVIF